MTTLLEWAAGIATLLGFIGATRRWIVMPIARAVRDGRELLKLIREAGMGVRELRAELMSFAGAVVWIEIGRGQQMGDLEQRLTDTAELVIDNAADINRMKHRIEVLEHAS
jgi:hypothetical protein